MYNVIFGYWSCWGKFLIHSWGEKGNTVVHWKNFQHLGQAEELNQPPVDVFLQCEWGEHWVNSLLITEKSSSENSSEVTSSDVGLLNRQKFSWTQTDPSEEKEREREKKQVIVVTVAIDIFQILGLRLVWTSVLFFCVCVFTLQPQYSSKTIQ